MISRHDGIGLMIWSWVLSNKREMLYLYCPASSSSDIVQDQWSFCQVSEINKWTDGLLLRVEFIWFDEHQKLNQPKLCHWICCSKDATSTSIACICFCRTISLSYIGIFNASWLLFLARAEFNYEWTDDAEKIVLSGTEDI